MSVSEKQLEKKHTVLELILIVCVLFVPYLIGNAILVILVVAVLLVLLSFLILALFGIGEFVAGIALVGIGIEKMFAMPMGAVAVIGFGICNIGVALLLECLVFWFYGMALPTVIKKIIGREDSHEETT